MQNRKLFILAPVIFLIGVIVSLVLFTKDFVYEVSLNDELKDSKVRVGGLIKKYSLDEGGSGEIYEIEDWVMTHDIVDLKVKAPNNIKKYSDLVAEVVFENNDNPTFEIGVRKKFDYKLAESLFDWDYSFLDNKYLNEYQKYLGEKWKIIDDKNRGLTLMQKEDSYSSINDFLKNPPKKIQKKVAEIDELGTKSIAYDDVPKIATLDYHLKQKFDFEQEEADSFFLAPFTFRGDLDLYLYFDKEVSSQLELSFFKQDINAREGIDQYELKIYDYKDELVYYKIFDDDGMSDRSEIVKMEQYHQKISLPESGGYLIKLVYQGDGEDSFIRNIQVNMPHVLLNNFLVVDQDGFLAENLITKPMTFYSSKGLLSIIPDHSDEGDQMVTINDLEYFVERQDRDSTIFNLEQDLNEITTTKNDLYISHRSNFVSMNPSAFFDMNPNKTTEYQSNDYKSEYNYLIANYILPEVNDNTKKNSQKFSLNNIFIDDDGFIHLKLRARGLESYKNEIVISDLKIILQK